MNRKQFLTKSMKGAALSMVAPTFGYCQSRGKQKADNNTNDNQNFIPDVDIELTSTPGSINILEGGPTDIYTYKTNIINDEKNLVSQLPDSYLGPVFRVKYNQNIRVRYKNKLPRESIIHWHGLHIPPKMDGHPMYAISEGEEFIYEFTVNNPPGTYWFHPHPDKITGPQVYHGLAGLFIVEDENNNLPKGDYDLPVVIQDRNFNAENQLIYAADSRMTQMQGFLGDKILINGSISKMQEVERTAYRFRVLNGSNSRIYKLAWSDNSAITVIATDGGLLPKPVEKPYLMLAPGERAEIWKDFSSYEANGQLTLKSLSFNDGSSMGMGRMGGMMGQMRMQQNQIPNGHEIDLMKFTISEKPPEPKPLNDNLTNPEYISPESVSNVDSPRKFHFFNDHMQWVINGETFEMYEVADWEKVKAGSKEIWQFINGNDGSGMGMGMMQNMMQMPHPVHIHGFSFQITERDTTDMDAGVWDSVKDGFVDNGIQDTFLLMPGMKVNVLLSFEDFTGMYIYHCHNLEHEDMGMMRNFEILNNK